MFTNSPGAVLLAHRDLPPLKARILLKADASELGESWSDSQIAEALDTSVDRRAR